MAFSRISIGEKNVETTDLGKIVEEIRAELKELIEEKTQRSKLAGSARRV